MKTVFIEVHNGARNEGGLAGIVRELGGNTHMSFMCSKGFPTAYIAILPPHRIDELRAHSDVAAVYHEQIPQAVLAGYSKTMEIAAATYHAEAMIGAEIY